MTQRYIDLAFDDTSPRSFGGFDNENEATVIRLKVLDPDAKYYIEIEQACGKHDKYCSDVLPVDDGYAVFEVPRDFTHETLYVQGVMKVDGMCRKTARVRVGFSHSINALDELPESQPSWADSVDERIDGLEMGMKDAVTYTPQTLTEEQKSQARTNIGVGQPDWNQNDSTQPDYVKNRPFYTGNPVETVLVEESTVQFTDIGGVCAGAIESTFSPTVGNAYKVYWDGTDYESACVEVGQDKCIGNLSIDGSGPDTGEPFLMYVTNQGIDVATLNYAAYHTISISRFVPGVVKIDEKYLPDTIATKQYVDTAKTEAQQLGLTAATPGQIIKVKAVQDGKPTEWEAADGEVPSVTASDNGKFLRVVSGAWTAVEIENANGGSF